MIRAVVSDTSGNDTFDGAPGAEKEMTRNINHLNEKIE